MKNENLKSALVLGISIFLGLACLGYFLGTSVIKFKEYERTVTVKGLSERDYPADIALWPIHFSQAGNDLASLYASIDADSEKIVAFLKSNGFGEEEITKSPPSIIDKLAQGYETTVFSFSTATEYQI